MKSSSTQANEPKERSGFSSPFHEITSVIAFYLIFSHLCCERNQHEGKSYKYDNVIVSSFIELSTVGFFFVTELDLIFSW